MPEKLTIKQQRFVDYYNGNATEAALKAGYSKRTAARTGSENLQKPLVAEAIKNREQKRSSKKIATREERQNFWTQVMNDPEEDMKNRLRAAELLGKSEADFLDRIKDETGPRKIILKRQDDD